MSKITDERLAELLQKKEARVLTARGVFHRQDMADTAAALRELQAARAVMDCYCPRCEGRYWVEHQCPVS